MEKKRNKGASRTKAYWRELYQESLHKTLEDLDIKGEKMKLIIQVIVGSLVIGLIFSLIFIGVKGLDSTFDSIVAIVIGTLSTSICIYFGLEWASRFMAFGNIFRLAAEWDENKKKDIANLDEAVEKLKKKLHPEHRTFPRLQHHKEYIVKNGSPKIVLDYLSSRLTKAMIKIRTKDRQVNYYIDGISYFPPREGSLECGVVVTGTKESEVYPLGLKNDGNEGRDVYQEKLIEMFVISLSQGGSRKNKQSLMCFDTEVEEIMMTIEKMLLRELKRGSFILEDM